MAQFCCEYTKRGQSRILQVQGPIGSTFAGPSEWCVRTFLGGIKL